MPTATSTAAPGDSTDRGASASPPPQAPTASAPGPRGAAFIKLYNNALSTTLQSVSYESFAACFPTIAKQAPTSLKGFHADFVGKMEKFAKVRVQNTSLVKD
jgi:kinetochore protein NNF1